MSKKIPKKQYYVETVTDRIIPAPPIWTETMTNRQVHNWESNVKKWLIEQAISEAESRNDEFNLVWMRHETHKNLPPASMSQMNLYLFGEMDPEWKLNQDQGILERTTADEKWKHKPNPCSKRFLRDL